MNKAEFLGKRLQWFVKEQDKIEVPKKQAMSWKEQAEMDSIWAQMKYYSYLTKVRNG